MRKKRILVIGASGSLGYKICEAFIKLFPNSIDLYISDYKIDRGIQTAEKISINKKNVMKVNVNDKISISAALSQSIDCVVVAIAQQDILIQQICNERKIPCVDVTAFKSFSEKLKRKIPDPNTTLVVMAGFYPGLSGILVKSLKDDFPKINEVQFFLLQNINAQVGISGIHDMLKIISKPLLNGNKGFDKFSKETFNNKEYKLREINHDEAQLLQEKLQIDKVTYYTSWNHPLFNSIISFIIKCNLKNLLLRVFKKFNLSKNNQNTDETIYLKIRGTELEGSRNQSHEVCMKFHSDYKMTANCAALIANYLAEKSEPKGIFLPFELVNSKDIDFLNIDL